MRYVAAILIALLAIGCKHDPSVVGKWTGTLDTADVTADFEPDQTMTFNVKVNTMGADVTGTYKTDEKNLTLDFKTYKLKAVPDTLKTTADTFMKGMTEKPYKLTYHFNSEDALAITYNGTTDVWTRVKDSQ